MKKEKIFEVRYLDEPKRHIDIVVEVSAEKAALHSIGKIINDLGEAKNIRLEVSHEGENPRVFCVSFEEEK